MAAPIHCCYRGCTLTVWVPREEGLVVDCSSLTCMSCRRVALCLPHFEALFSAQRHLKCPNCSQQRWYGCLFEPARLDPALLVAIESAGGRVERRLTGKAPAPRPEGPTPDASSARPRRGLAHADATRVDAGSAVESTPPEAPDALLRHAESPAAARAAELGAPPGPAGRLPRRRRTGVIDPALRPWKLVSRRAVPSDARLVAPGVLARRTVGGTRLAVEGEPLLWEPPGSLESVARLPGNPLMVVAHQSGDGRVRLSWLTGGQYRGTLTSPLGGDLRAPALVDGRRFVYVAIADGMRTLAEATAESGGRIRTRRIADLGPMHPALPSPVVFQNREAVIAFAGEAQGPRPVRVRLADGRRTTLDGSQPPPRCLVAAPRGAYTAWITADGEVRCTRPGQAARVLGQTETDLLAIADDGSAVAWPTRDHLAIVSLPDGGVKTAPLSAPIVAIEWIGDQSRAA